ncbi:hypothetical protein K1719_045744 [Acacia pycnantha]|nr:hypothetical protein K1719_045744 [Acacia pycnantha]
MIKDESLFRNALFALFTIAPFLQALYGQAPLLRMGSQLSPPLARFLMESPAIRLALLLFPHGGHSSNLRSLILISPFLLHYFNRTILYPFAFSNRPHRKPLVVSLLLIRSIYDVLL